MVAGGPREASDHRFPARWHTTAAAVAEECQAAWYLIRDAIRRRTSICPSFRWSLAS
ncbi:MAG: hypothetical protein QOE68_1070, partial [Thermoanaerobaculia bacterium]|nr:hypothetical protein [Thermoanaerobaculia bacterium]